MTADQLGGLKSELALATTCSESPPLVDGSVAVEGLFGSTPQPT